MGLQKKPSIKHRKNGLPSFSSPKKGHITNSGNGSTWFWQIFSLFQRAKPRFLSKKHTNPPAKTGTCVFGFRGFMTPTYETFQLVFFFGLEQSQWMGFFQTHAETIIGNSSPLCWSPKLTCLFVFVGSESLRNFNHQTMNFFPTPNSGSGHPISRKKHISFRFSVGPSNLVCSNLMAIHVVWGSELFKYNHSLLVTLHRDVS